MSLHTLVDKATGKVLSVRDMSPEVAEYLNDEISVTEHAGKREWQRGLGGRKQRQVKSLHHIARTLDTEGFSEYTLHTIEDFLKQEVKDKASRMAQYQETKAQFVEVVRNMHEDDRKAISKFITAQASISFNAGMRIGLTGHHASEILEAAALLEDASAKATLARMPIIKQSPEMDEYFSILEDM